jgi:hypothetical protein
MVSTLAIDSSYLLFVTGIFPAKLGRAVK